MATQGLGGHALGKQCFHPPRLALFDPVANPELVVFQQRDEAAPEAQKIGGAHHKRLQKMLQIAAGTEFGRNLQQLVEFVRLGMRGGVQFGVRHGDGAKSGDRRHQRFFFGRENAVLPRVDQDRALRARSAKRSRNQHPGRNQIAQRVHVGADGNRDRLSGGDGALRQIGGEADGLAVMPGPSRVRQLRSLGRNRPQFKRAFAPQQDANQPRPQKQAQAVGQGLDHGGDIRSAVQRMGDVRQNLGAAVLFAGNIAEPRRFQQAAQLAGQDRGLGGQIFVKEVVDGIVQKRDRPNHFVGDQQRRGQQRAGAKLLGRGESRGLHVVAENRAPLAHRLGGNGTLVRTHAQADKAVRQLAVGLLSHQFLPGMGIARSRRRKPERTRGWRGRTTESGNWRRTARPPWQQYGATASGRPHRSQG